MSNKTNFEKVIDFNKCFGSIVSDNLNPQLFNSHPKIVDLKYSLINEEVNELLDAYYKNDIKEIIDALSDIKYVLYGMAAAFGINMDKSFNNYFEYILNYKNESNFSDFKLVFNEYQTNFNVNEYLQNINNKDYSNICEENIIEIKDINMDLERYTKEKDIKNIELELNKLLFYVNKFACIIGFDLDLSFNIVHNSNMTKVCNTEELAIKTVEWYKNNDDRYNSPSYRKNEYGYIIYNNDTGKILKSINYVPANFSDLLN